MFFPSTCRIDPTTLQLIGEIYTCIYASTSATGWLSISIFDRHDTCRSIYFTTIGILNRGQHVYHPQPLKSNNIVQKPDNNLHMNQFARTANRYLEVSYNRLPFTMTNFLENILEFVRQTTIIEMVSLRFSRLSDDTYFKRVSTVLYGVTLTRCATCV